MPRAEDVDRYRFELLALRLALHGPEAVDHRITRALAKTLGLELRSLLRSHGFVDYEINYLMGTHPQGCACWECVMALHWAVRRHQKRFRRAFERSDAAAP